MNDRIVVRNAMDHPEERERIEAFVGLMRMALAPTLNREVERLPENQSCIVSASALMAGMTVGHMIAVGAMREGDKARAAKVVQVAFRNGIKLGQQEAQQAMLEQMPPKGSA